MPKWLTLEFLPRNTDLGLLILRLGFAGSMLALHGWGKLQNLISYLGGSGIKMPDVIGIGAPATLILAVLAEFFCSALIVIGLWTRLASLFLAATMGVAFVFFHKMALTGGNSGEEALVFLVGFVVILAAGAGKYSLDRK